MNEHYSLLACVAVALANLVLSVSISAFVNMRSNDLSFMTNARDVYASHRELLLTSTLIVLVTTYMAVEFRPNIKHILPELSVLNDILPKRKNIKNLTKLY